MAKKQALPAECQKLVERVAGQVLDLTREGLHIGGGAI